MLLSERSSFSFSGMFSIPMNKMLLMISCCSDEVIWLFDRMSSGFI